MTALAADPTVRRQVMSAALMLKGADLSSSVVQTGLLVLGGIAPFFVGLASTTIKRKVA